MTTHIAPVIAPEACERLALLRDLADAADIILRDQEEINLLEGEIATRTARLEELRANVSEGISLYRDATAQLGSDPTGLVDHLNGAAPKATRGTDTHEKAPRTPITRSGTSAGERILAVLSAAQEPMDARQIAERSGLPLTRVRPALTQLKSDEKIIHAGSRAVDHTRRRASLYTLAEDAART